MAIKRKHHNFRVIRNPQRHKHIEIFDNFIKFKSHVIHGMIERRLYFRILQIHVLNSIYKQAAHCSHSKQKKLNACYGYKIEHRKYLIAAEFLRNKCSEVFYKICPVSIPSCSIDNCRIWLTETVHIVFNHSLLKYNTHSAA